MGALPRRDGHRRSGHRRPRGPLPPPLRPSERLATAGIAGAATGTAILLTWGLCFGLLTINPH